MPLPHTRSRCKTVERDDQKPELSAPQTSWWTALQLFVEMLTGSALFVLIAAPAVGFALLVNWLDARHIDSVVTMGLRLAEYATFVVDLMLYACFLRSTFRRHRSAL